MFESILAAFVARLANVSGARPIVSMQPYKSDVPYDGKTGVRVFVQSPEPEKRSGAGRWGYKVSRRCAVLCVTESLNDIFGQGGTAVTKHLQFERSICDAAMDFNATPIATGAYQIMWVGGGEEIMRYMKLNPGLNGSVLMFEFSYEEALTPGT